MSSHNSSTTILSWIRVTAMSLILLIFAVGTPSGTSAIVCEDFFLTCSTESACFDVKGNDCGCPGGKVSCTLSDDCLGDEEFPVTTYCKQEQVH